MRYRCNNPSKKTEHIKQKKYILFVLNKSWNKGYKNLFLHKHEN